MNLPTQEEASKLLEIVHKLKDIENSRSEEEKELISKFYDKKITDKEFLKILKDKKLLSNSKKKDEEFIKELITYNDALINFSKELDINYNLKIYSKKRSELNKLINSLFLAKPKMEVKRPEKKTVPKVSEIQPKIPETHHNILENAFKLLTKNKNKFEEPIKISEQPTPVFEEPKELLPENYQVLIPGFAYAFVEEKAGSRRYIVAEPELTSEENKILENTKQELINRISLIDLKDESQLIKTVEKTFSKNKLDSTQKSKIIYYVVRQIKGLDAIEPLMHDPLIEDIECDGTNIPIFIVHRKYGHIETNVLFKTEKELQQFVIKMAHLSRSYVSYASPLLDAILPDGSRVNATLTSNVSTRGPTFTIRKFPQKPLTAIDLINSGTLTPTLVGYIWTVMEFQKTALIIGPTAGGKTTLLNVITSFIPPGRRVVSIEDTREINLLLDNWIPQVTRPGFGPPDSSGKKYGEVTMLDLIKESFRQRPDYLILGEVRGEEMSVMFQGMASGHCCLSTVHARSVNDLVNRLITPPISLEPSLLTSLDLVIVTGFSGGSETKRTIKELDEILGFNVKDNKIEFNAVYSAIDKKKPVKKEGDLFTTDLPITYKSEILKKVAKEYNININTILEVINKRIAFIEELTKNPPKDYIEFKLAINKFKSTEEELKEVT
jgi:flagellar protein FlaI